MSRSRVLQKKVVILIQRQNQSKNDSIFCIHSYICIIGFVTLTKMTEMSVILPLFPTV